MMIIFLQGVLIFTKKREVDYLIQLNNLFSLHNM